MSHFHSIPTQPNHRASILKPLLAGASVALLVICFFIFGADNTKPEWGEYWQIRPLIITPLAGAAGGFCFYIINRFFARNRWNKALAVFLGILVFIVGLWMGIVLGLDGTMWD